MVAYALPMDATSGSPSYNAEQTRTAFAALMGWAPSGRPLGAASGVRPGTPTNTVTVTTSGGASTWSVGAHCGVLDVQSSALAGPYLYASNGADTGNVTAADATYPRVDIIYVQVSDNVQDSTGFEQCTLGYLAGTPAATPAAPATPPRSMVLAQINVPASGGGNPSVSWVAPTWGVHSWSTYTPSLTNVTLGNGTISGRYTYDPQKKLIDGSITFKVGSTTSVSGTMQFSLPMALNANAVVNGTCVSQTSPYSAGVLYLAGASTIQCQDGSGASWSASKLPPAGSYIYIAFRGEVA